MRREDLQEPVASHPKPMRRTALSALPEAEIPTFQQSDPIIVTMDVELPADRMLGAELDLIERHLGDLLQEMLLLDNDSKE